MKIDGEDEKTLLRPENKSSRSYYEIRPFGRLHTSRFHWV